MLEKIKDELTWWLLISSPPDEAIVTAIFVVGTDDDDEFSCLDAPKTVKLDNDKLLLANDHCAVSVFSSDSLLVGVTFRRSYYYFLAFCFLFLFDGIKVFSMTH